MEIQPYYEEINSSRPFNVNRVVMQMGEVNSWYIIGFMYVTEILQMNI